MKKIHSLLAAALLLAAGQASAQQALSGGVKEQIDQVQAAIEKAGAKWTAGENNISSDRENWKYYVGLDFEPIDAEPVALDADAPLPPAFDWRDANGVFVTPIRNQKKCGSCWAFSMTAGLEAYTLLKENTPGRNLDLSEQVMLSCSGAGSCNGGRLSAGFLSKTGLPPETDYPYTATDGSCKSAAAGWQGRSYRIGAYGSVRQSVQALKAALVKYGPLPTAYMVYEDFMHYKSGVYSYTTGKRLGGHAVLLVGYNDPEQYFIVKNSWDTGWGENGYFRIAYSQMDNQVNFGLSTIAYRESKDEAPVGDVVLGGAWKRVAPMFEGVNAWN